MTRVKLGQLGFTSEEKDGLPDSRSVMNRIFFYIKYQTFHTKRETTTKVKKGKWNNGPCIGIWKSWLIEDPALKEAPCVESLILFNMDISTIHSYIFYANVRKKNDISTYFFMHAFTSAKFDILHYSCTFRKDC